MIDFLKKDGNSKLQEVLAEYAFLKDLILDGIRNRSKVLVSRSDFDAFGYDVLVQLEGQKRLVKIQLKATNGKAKVWDVHKSLLEDEDGYVVLVKIEESNNDLCFNYYTISGPKDHILERKPKVAHSRKCQLRIADLSPIEKDSLIRTFFESK